MWLFASGESGRERARERESSSPVCQTAQALNYIWDVGYNATPCHFTSDTPQSQPPKCAIAAVTIVYLFVRVL